MPTTLRPFGPLVRFGLFLLALAGCASALAEDPPERVDLDHEQLLADAKAQRVELLRNESADLARAKIALRRLKAGRDSLAKADAVELSRMLGQWEKEIAAARRGKLLLAPYLWPRVSDPVTPYRGRVGRLTTKLVVFQVTGEDSFLARALGDDDLDIAGLAWFEGLSTANMHDGLVVSLIGWNEVFVCTGGKSYTNALGSTKTVPAFRPLTADEMAAVRRTLADGK